MYSNSISEIERLSILNKLIEECCWTSSITQSIRLAKDLARTIDEFNLHKIASDKLTEELSSFFSEHWQQRTKFLRIVTKYWPMMLKERGKTDIKTYKYEDKIPNSYINLKTITHDVMSGVDVFEAESIYDEIEFIVRKIEEKRDKKIAVISPDNNFTKLISEKLKFIGIEFTSETNDEIEKIPPEFLEEIERNFPDVSEDDKVILAGELLSFVKIKKEEDKGVFILGLNNTPLNTDVIFCVNLNEDSWQYGDYGKFLLHSSIRRKLKLRDISEYVENCFCTYIKSANEIYLTRAKKTNGTDKCRAPVFAKFKAMCQKNNLKINYTEKLEKRFFISPTIQQSIKFDVFPNILTSQDIELLMKNPEGFYAKKILDLQTNDINKCEQNFFVVFKKIMRECFTNGTSLQLLLSSVKELDFFRYQKCINVVNWLQKRSEVHESKNDIYGKIRVQNFDIELRGHCDRVEFNGDFASIISYRTTTPQSVKEIIYGSESSVMTTCLIADKGGFEEIKKPIEEIQIWSIASSGKEPIDIKNISISKDIIKSFEERFVETLKNYEQGRVDFENAAKLKYNKYKHFERI
jgi:hypothetical protein